MLSRGPGQSRFTLALLVVISVSILSLDLLGVGPIGLIRSGVNGALSPVRAVGDAVFGGGDDSDEVARLEARIEELEGFQLDALNLEAELRRLQAAIGILPESDVPAVSANVTSRAVGNFDQTIEIDRGAEAGIEVNMPVRIGTGLVGIIDSVTFTSARVLLISDQNLNVGVVHSESGDKGIAHGQGEGEPLLIDGAFDAATEIFDGDLFVTAGTDGSNFPPGIPVGRALARGGANNPLEQQVVLAPTASLEGLDQVAVLLFTPGAAGPADDEDDADAAEGDG